MKNIKLLVALFMLSAIAFSQADTTKYKPVALPPGFIAQLDVVYTTVADWEGKMDIYLPPRGKTPKPVAINIHSGGWSHGVKESQTGFNAFFQAGFAVANIEYRLTGQATAPAAIEDTRCALAYLVKNAKALNVDVNRIVIMGGSAGGHLALMGGLLGNDHRFDGNCPGIANMKVAAIINKYGITDVWDWGHGKVIKSKYAQNWLGKYADDEKFAASVSPISYVDKQSPPVFIVHGDADPMVPYQQSVDLYNKLQAAGVQAQFITVEGGQHGKFAKEKSSEVNEAIITFLRSIKSLGVN